MLNFIKTLKRFCRAILIVLYNKKNNDKILIYDRFFVSNRNFTTEHVKIVKSFRLFHVLFKIPDFTRFFFQNFSNSRFFMPKLSNSRFFQVKCQPCYVLLILITLILIYETIELKFVCYQSLKIKAKFRLT